MDYKVVIVSHDRIHSLKKKTLSTLDRYGIPKDKIYIFVAEDEEDKYREALEGYKICPGEKGLERQRNAVTRYFEPDEHLLCLDDDITGFFTSENKKCVPLADLDAFVKYAFGMAVKEGVSLWGFYPVKNALWLKNSIQKGLVFCYGCAYGLINKKDIQIDYALKEDFERTIKFYLRDGKVLRFNWVCPAQTYLKGKGGLSSFRTYQKEEEACDRLIALYPFLCKKRTKKDRVDVVLVSRNEAGLEN